MAKAFTNPWSPQRSPISQDELGTAFMFFTLQALIELDGLPSRLAVCCTSDPEDGHVEEPWSAVPVPMQRPRAEHTPCREAQSR